MRHVLVALRYHLEDLIEKETSLASEDEFSQYWLVCAQHVTVTLEEALASLCKGSDT